LQEAADGAQAFIADIPDEGVPVADLREGSVPGWVISVGCAPEPGATGRFLTDFRRGRRDDDCGESRPRRPNPSGRLA
jgi:hypothetical protein